MRFLLACVPPTLSLAVACSSTGGEITSPPDAQTIGTAGSQSAPVAGRAGAAGVAGRSGQAGAAGVAISQGGGGGHAGTGAGGSALTCPPDGATVPACGDVPSQTCGGCVCATSAVCADLWAACRGDSACARGLGCLLGGCPGKTCAVVAGEGYAMLVSVLGCFGGPCAPLCTGEPGVGGSSGAAGSASGGKSGGAGTAGKASGGGNPGQGGAVGVAGKSGASGASLQAGFGGAGGS